MRYQWQGVRCVFWVGRSMLLFIGVARVADCGATVAVCGSSAIGDTKRGWQRALRATSAVVGCEPRR